MKIKSQVIHTILTFSAILAVILTVNKLNLIERINLDEVIRYVESNGRHAGITFVLLIALKSFLIIIPSSIFSVAGGILFGPVKGFILNLMGFFVSGTIVFFFSRFLGKSYIDKILKGKLIKLDKRIESNGFKLLFLLRLPPIFPYDLLSATAGVTNIRYSTFILASTLGVIPETLCYSIIGRSLGDTSDMRVILTFLFMIVTILLTLFVYKKNQTV